MAADLDVLIRSSSDPLVALVYHRHFTHSLAFVPIGGVLVALPWLLRRKFDAQRKWILAATTLGYATHALLDCCTSYGTLLLWPFSDLRVAWSFISIIDPIYTLPLALGVGLSAWTGRLRPVLIAVLIAHLYMALCGVQKLRALELRDRLARSRGHVVERSFVQNLFATNLAWRSLYTFEGRVYADAIYTPWLGEPLVEEGSVAELGSVFERPPAVRDHPRTLEGYELFAWFASGWVVIEPAEAQVNAEAVLACDIRYSRVPSGFAPLWCLRLSPGDAAPVERVDHSRDVRMGRLLEASFFAPPSAHPLEP